MPDHDQQLENAVSAMLGELRAEQDREAELSHALIAARHRRAELVRSLTIFIKTFPEADRRRHAGRLARLAASRDHPRGRHGATDRSRAVLDFLAGHPGEEFLVAELDRVLAGAGLETSGAYAAQALHRNAAQGLVTRLGYGRYRINHTHPDLVAIRREGLERGDVPE